MNGKDFYELYQARWNETHGEDDKITKAKAEAYCRTMLDLLDEQLDEMPAGDRVTFYGFGTFAKRKKPAHVIGDLKTGGRIEVPAKDVVVFTRAERK